MFDQLYALLRIPRAHSLPFFPKFLPNHKLAATLSADLRCARTSLAISNESKIFVFSAGQKVVIRLFVRLNASDSLTGRFSIRISPFCPPASRPTIYSVGSALGTLVDNVTVPTADWTTEPIVPCRGTGDRQDPPRSIIYRWWPPSNGNFTFSVLWSADPGTPIYLTNYFDIALDVGLWGAAFFTDLDPTILDGTSRCSFVGCTANGISAPTLNSNSDVVIRGRAGVPVYIQIYVYETFDSFASTLRNDFKELRVTLAVAPASSAPPSCTAAESGEQPVLTLNSVNTLIPVTLPMGNAPVALQPGCNGGGLEVVQPSVFVRLFAEDRYTRVRILAADFPIAISVWSEPDYLGHCVEYSGSCVKVLSAPRQPSYTDSQFRESTVGRAVQLDQPGPFIVQFSSINGSTGNFTFDYIPEVSGSGCFPASATVVAVLKPGRTHEHASTVLVPGLGERAAVRIPIADLRVGDMVLTMGNDGQLTFEDVYLFSHKQANIVGEFVEISTADGQQLRLSPRHFIPHVSGSRSGAGPSMHMRDAMTIVAAEEIVVGNFVQTLAVDHEGQGLVQLSQVVGVRRVVDVGVFAPLTMGGMIMVDDVLVSAHSDFVLDRLGVSPAWQHNIYQAAGSLARAIYKAVGAEIAAWLAEDHGLGLTNRIISLERTVADAFAFMDPYAS